MLHGRGSDPVGGAGPELDGDWLVQAVPYLVDGGAYDGAAHPPLVTDVSGEHHPLLRKIVNLITLDFYDSRLSFDLRRGFWKRVAQRRVA